MLQNSLILQTYYRCIEAILCVNMCQYVCNTYIANILNTLTIVYPLFNTSANFFPKPPNTNFCDTRPNAVKSCQHKARYILRWYQVRVVESDTVWVPVLACSLSPCSSWSPFNTLRQHIDDILTIFTILTTCWQYGQYMVNMPSIWYCKFLET